MQKDHTLETLNELLRGELAATETYQQAMDKIENGPAATELRMIHGEHRDAANELRIHVREHGGEPDRTSGAWGTFAKAIEGGAKLFGQTAAIKALKEGEEHGVNSYEKAIEDPDMPDDCRTLIRSRLLPTTRAHITALDRIMSMSS